MSGKVALLARNIDWQKVARQLNGAKLKEGAVISNARLTGRADAGVSFNVVALPWFKNDLSVQVDGNDIHLWTSSYANIDYTGMEKAIGVSVNPRDHISGLPDLKNVRVPLKGLRESALAKTIAKMIEKTNTYEYIKMVRQEMPIIAKARIINGALSWFTPNGWTDKSSRGGRYSYLRPIKVGAREIGNYQAELWNEGSTLFIEMEIQSSSPNLESKKKKFKFNLSRANNAKMVKASAQRAINSALSAMKPLVDAAVKKEQATQVSEKKWLDAVKKRAKTAFRGSKPLVVNNSMVEFVAFEYKDRGKALYYVSFGLRKMQFGKTLKGQVFARLGTYKENVEKYLKVSLDNSTMADYFLEDETLYSRTEEFKLMSDITKKLKEIAPKLKEGIKQAKVEGKEATPETANFIKRKEQKVSEKQRERERREEREWRLRNIEVVDDETPRGVTVWSAVSHDQGYAERVVEGFRSEESAKEYILSIGGGDDWVVVHGTQLDGKRLGRVEEGYED